MMYQEIILRLTVGVGYGNVVMMSPQYEYYRSPLLVSKNKVYIAKQLQHLISQTPNPYIGKTTATSCDWCRTASRSENSTVAGNNSMAGRK